MPSLSPVLSKKFTALSKRSGEAGLTFIHSINSLVQLVKKKTPSSKKTPKPAPAKSRDSKHHLLTLSIKVTISKHVRKRDVHSDDEDREEIGDGDGLWQKGILLGDKCEPLDFSGVIYYDNAGNQLPEFPARSRPAAASLPNEPRSFHPSPNISPSRLAPLEKISEKSDKDGHKNNGKLKKLASSVRSVLDKLPRLKHRKGDQLVALPGDSLVDDDISEDEKGWLITGNEPGGPLDATVIPSFGGHVARDIWAGIERGPLKYQNQGAILHSLKAWQWNSLEARTMVDKSGLTHLSDTMHPVINMNLVSAFVERWQPDTNTFHMPFGEMTILLHDVYKILGIPVEGLAVGGSQEKLDSPEECYANEIFGSTIGEMRFDRLKLGQGGVPNSYLYSATIETLDDERHAQGMLAFLLGNTLFPNKSGRVNSCVFPLVKDIDKVSSFAWGTATLANLYRELGMASRAESRNISGCLTLLQAWIYEYFPSFAPPVVITPPGCPRADRWERPYIVPSDQMEYYRESLNAMRPEDVNWMPFGGGMDEEVPTTLYAGLIRFGSVIEPYNPSRVLRQLGYRQDIPMLKHIDPPLEVNRDRAVSEYSLKYDIAAADWSWNSGITIPRSVKLERIVAGNEYSEEYNAWFRRVSHPRIGNLMQASSSQSTIDIVEEMESWNHSPAGGIGWFLNESDPSD